MRGPARRCPRRNVAIIMIATAFAVVGGDAIAGGGTVAIDNRSDHPVKVALPGGPGRVIAAGEPAVNLRIDADDDAVGTTVRLWWVSDPLQLCQIVTPWDRTVTVTGTVEIRCRSR